MIRSALFVIILIGVDQWSKWMVEALLPFQQKIEFLPFIAWFRTYNKGIAFSFLNNLGPNWLIAIALGITVLVIWLWSSLPKGRTFSWLGYGLICAGALGNLVDRIRFGYVIDFVQFHTPSWSFAIFNLADSFIAIGATSIIVDEFLHLKRSESATSGKG